MTTRNGTQQKTTKTKIGNTNNEKIKEALQKVIDEGKIFETFAKPMIYSSQLYVVMWKRQETLVKILDGVFAKVQQPPGFHSLL